MAYEISKSKSLLSMKFILGNVKQDLLEIVNVFLSIGLSYLIFRSHVILMLIAALILILINSVLIYSKLQEQLFLKLKFSKQLHNASYYDNKIGSFVPFSKIKYGAAIIKDNNRPVKINKVKPIDLTIKDEQQQHNIYVINNKFFKSLSGPIQLSSKSEKPNLEPLLSNWDLEIQKNSFPSKLTDAKRHESRKKWLREDVSGRNRVYYIAYPYSSQSEALPMSKRFKNVFLFLTGKTDLSEKIADNELKIAAKRLNNKNNASMNILAKTEVDIMPLNDNELISLNPTYYHDVSEIDEDYTTPYMMRI